MSTPPRRAETGTVTDLLNLRARLARLQAVTEELIALGYTSLIAAPTTEARELAATPFYVMLACMLCRNRAAVPAVIGDESVPSAVICGTCSARLDRAMALAGTVETDPVGSVEHYHDTDGGPPVRHTHPGGDVPHSLSEHSPLAGGS